MDQPAGTEIVLVLTTLDERADAPAFARTLVTECLAACVNVLPAMLSIYRWKGAVESASEQQLVIKTSSDRLEALKARLSELHPYEVPEILVVAVNDAAPSYLAWLADAVSPPATRRS